MNLKDALKKAYAEEGLDLPVNPNKDEGWVVLARGSNGQRRPVQVTVGRAVGRPVANTPRNPPPRSSRAATNTQRPQQAAVQASRPAPVPNTNNRTADAPKDTPEVAIKPSVIIHADAVCNLQKSDSISRELLDLDVSLGQRESLHSSASADVHDMSFGLDFGTSSVKVVLADLSSDKAYAVPFLSATGIDQFLLPSRLFESDSSGFSLDGGDRSFRDLKLGLLGNPKSVDRQVEVIAFLGLIILRARAWFFTEHHNIYGNVKCAWQLRVGLPAASALGNDFAPLFEQLLQAAWRLAAHNQATNRLSVEAHRQAVIDKQTAADSIEVRVIPEIAAQIYGFVVSTSFDTRAANRYLMVDVGAGTVDVSLFKVFQERGGLWGFEFYTAVVQPYGVSNLHAYRVDWWLDKLKDVDGAEAFMDELRASKFSTDLGPNLPSKNSEYFKGIEFTNEDPDNVDWQFLDKKLLSQIQGQTLHRAVTGEFVSREQLKNIPLFLCGGGSRGPLYLSLEERLQGLRGFSYLSAEPWQLGFPGDLEADGVNEVNFDRLSVAYGLSKANFGTITQAVPLPKVPIAEPAPFTDRYIEN